MKLKSKLKLITILPTLILVVAATYLFYNTYVNYEKTKAYKTIMKNNKYLDKVFIEIGQERGIAALYLSSGKTKQKELLDKQIQKTNRAIKNYKNHLIVDSGSLLTKDFISNEPIGINKKIYTNLNQKLKELPKIRASINNYTRDNYKGLLDNYTNKLTKPILNTLLKLNSFSLNSDVNRVSNNLSNLYISQEYTGLLRDFLLYNIENKKIVDNKMLSEWISYHSKAMLFDPNMIESKKLSKQLQEFLDTQYSNTVKEKFVDVYQNIITNAKSGNYNTDTLRLFTVLSKYISTYDKTANIIYNEAKQEISNYSKKYLMLVALFAFLLLISIILIIFGNKLAKELESNSKELEKSLKRAVNKIGETDPTIKDELEDINKIDFETSNGMKKGYQFLETMIESAKEDKIEAIEANKAKSYFLANMSHEIRTPMNGIIGFAELLKNTNLNDEQKEYVEIIEKSSDNLLDIINNILDLSKLESNRVELEHLIFDTAKEFDSAVDTFAVIASDKDIELNYFLDPEISPKLKGDPTKLKEILTNLLNNAIKFTESGGEIDIEINKSFKVQDDNRVWIEFTVRDSGIGMSKQQLERIFQPFMQGDSSINRKYGGTGLGLTITKQYIELLGGELKVESKENVGSTFHFTIPLEEIEGASSNYKGKFKDLNILIYQEDKDNKLAKYISNYLKYYGANYKTFSNNTDLKKLLDEFKSKGKKDIIIDIDIDYDKILDMLPIINKDELIIVSKVTNNNSLNNFTLPNERILFKPIGFNKFLSTLKYLAKLEHIEDEPDTTVQAKYKAKALVAEDNLINQKLIVNILKGFGLTIDVADNGQEAVNMLKNKNDYDLIFMDIQMPIMDGIEATKIIKRYEAENNLTPVPIIALTANALKGDRERLLKEGLDEYISKPIEMSELLYILHKFLSKKSYMNLTSTNSTKSEKTTTIVEKSAEDNKNKIKEIDKVKDIKSVKKRVLIAKKFPLSNKILSTLMASIDIDFDILEDGEDLKTKVSSGNYDILFTDENYLTNDLIDTIKKESISIVLTEEPQSNENFKDLSIKSIKQLTNKEEIISIINNIRKIDE